MDILWDMGVLALFVWFAILAGMLPIIIIHRIKMIRSTETNWLLTSRDSLSLLLFDVGIFITGLATVYFLYTGPHHDWWDLLLGHLMLGCFAVGLLLRKRQLQLTG